MTSSYSTTKVTKIRHFWLYIIAVVASLGGLLSGFDTGVVSGALLFINETWHMTSWEQGWIVSAAIVGAVLGAAMNGSLSDIYGRKKIIVATGIIFAVGSVMCAYATSPMALIISRVVIGLAVGMVNFVVPLYLSEIAPQKIRGMLVSLFQLAITAGILFSYLINRIFATAEYNWRWMLGAGLIPAIILLVGITFLGDTPRWLISKKRDKEAKEIFLKINPDDDADSHIAEVKATLITPQDKKGSAFKSWMLMPVFVGIGMMFMQICTGINTIIFYTTTIFKIAGFADNISAIYATIGIGAVNFLMTFVAIFFTDKWGRKPLLYIGLWGILFALASLGAAFHFADVLGDNLKWIAVASVVIYITAFAMSLGPIGWIMVSEILPLQIRGFAMSLCTVANFGFNFIVVLSFLPLIHSIGEAYTFWIFAGITVVCLLFTYYLVPETKGISLEKIEKNWREGVPARRFGQS